MKPHETKYICMPISVNLQCCNIEQLFGRAMKKKHWVLKEALGAQGSTGCSRKHCVLHWEKRKAFRIKWSSTCFFSIAVLASWCLLAFHPFGDVGYILVLSSCMHKSRRLSTKALVASALAGISRLSMALATVMV